MAALFTSPCTHIFVKHSAKISELTPNSAGRHPPLARCNLISVWEPWYALNIYHSKLLIHIIPPDGNITTLRDMVRDLDGSVYHDFVGSRIHLWDTPLNVPNIRSKDGSLMKPYNYKSELQHLTPVTVDINLKLYVLPFTRLQPNFLICEQLGYRKQ